MICHSQKLFRDEAKSDFPKISFKAASEILLVFWDFETRALPEAWVRRVNLIIHFIWFYNIHYIECTIHYIYNTVSDDCGVGSGLFWDVIL